MKEFVSPPTKDLNDMLQDNVITMQPRKPAISEAEQRILADITAKEEECLRVIHTRYCIPRALKIKVSDLSRLQPDSFNRPNYWEYYYRHGTPNEYFLMSREVAIIGGEVKLNIAFNADLAREGE